MNEHQESNNELAYTLGRIETTLERFEQTLDRFDHKLFGNGQPGEITVLNSRIGVLENFKSYIKGGFATLGALVTLIGGTELYHLFSGRR
jgi:hypothetical protein